MRKKVSFWPIWIIFIVSIGCNNFLPKTQDADLKIAYEKYSETLTNASLTLEFSQLSDVLTDEELKATVEHLETRKKYSMAFATETELISFAVLQNNNDQAKIRVKVYYRQFYLDPTTQERIYQTERHEYWRIYQYEMRKENNKWKVSRTEFIDWSG